MEEWDAKEFETIFDQERAWMTIGLRLLKARLAAKKTAEGDSVLAVDRSRSFPNQLQSKDLPVGEDTINA